MRDTKIRMLWRHPPSVHSWASRDYLGWAERSIFQTYRIRERSIFRKSKKSNLFLSKRDQLWPKSTTQSRKIHKRTDWVSM